LLERKDLILRLARKWNRISTSDCATLTGVQVIDPCGEVCSPRCSTGLSDEAFANLMAAIIHQERVLRNDNDLLGFITSSIEEPLETYIKGFIDGNPSLGIAAVRITTAYDLV
jgi:hypothetical protein